MNNVSRETLIDGAKALGFHLSEKQIEQFMLLGDLLIEWNQKINLTAITTPKEIVVLHFLDSVLALKAFEDTPADKIIDIGTGAGFPGLPLLIMRPEYHVTMVDATKKKLSFIEEALNRLGLKANVLHARAEILGQDSKHREQYDIVVSRAVANLQVLSEYCLPLAKVDGAFFALKGPGANDEIPLAENAIQKLGGDLQKVYAFKLLDDSTRNIIKIVKAAATPKQYPRHGGSIRKSPL